jgi:hypothetical protein
MEFDSQEKKGIFLLYKKCTQPLVPTQPPSQWISGFFAER